jgi:predicted TIM-barrel fold metal-dependent hydrolase
MDWQGVDRAVLLQGDFYGEANQYVARAVARYPDRLVGAAYVDPRAPDCREVLHSCLDEHGFGILKLEMSEDAGLTGLYPDLRLDEPGMRWLWQEADSRRLVVTLDLGSIGTRSYQTRELRAVLDDYPGLRVVIAHLAHPPLGDPTNDTLNQAWREQLLLGRRPNVWFDLAALPIYAPDEDFPYPSARDCIRQAVDEVGAGSLMWGTDIPGLISYATYEQLRTIVTRHCDFFTEEELAHVMGLNALEVYWGTDGDGVSGSRKETGTSGPVRRDAPE